MLTIVAAEQPIPRLQHYLQGAVGPRPICFASTIDAEGRRNLSPFSFFNVFSSNPPILVFSPARSGRTGATKDTLENVKAVPEVVINMVDYSMVQQTSLSSSPYPRGVDEFVKSGFTPIPADTIRPFRVKESPVQMECIVKDIIELGQAGGAGNLVICEVKLIHIREDILNAEGLIDQQKIDLVARMGGNWYCRAHGDALFEVQKPITTIGIGVDALPENIRRSGILTGNDLGLLGSLEQVPTHEEQVQFREHPEWTSIQHLEPTARWEQQQKKAQLLLKQQQVKEALLLLLQS